MMEMSQMSQAFNTPTSGVVHKSGAAPFIDVLVDGPDPSGELVSRGLTKLREPTALTSPTRSRAAMRAVNPLRAAP